MVKFKNEMRSDKEKREEIKSLKSMKNVEFNFFLLFLPHKKIKEKRMIKSVRK